VATTHDAWLDCYTSLVPSKLGACEARVLLDLLSEDHARLAEALVALADSGTDWCA